MKGESGAERQSDQLSMLDISDIKTFSEVC